VRGTHGAELPATIHSSSSQQPDATMLSPKLFPRDEKYQQLPASTQTRPACQPESSCLSLVRNRTTANYLVDKEGASVYPSDDPDISFHIPRARCMYRENKRRNRLEKGSAAQDGGGLLSLNKTIVAQAKPPKAFILDAADNNQPSVFTAPATIAATTNLCLSFHSTFKRTFYFS
jgi:hypothetical protein